MGLFISFDFGEHFFLFLILLNLTGTGWCFRIRFSSLAEKAAALPPRSTSIGVSPIAFGQIESWNLANIG